MALTGTLLADFNSFTAACAKAEVSLKSFEANGAKVEAQLNRATDALSGVKIVQQAAIAAEAVERLGGVSKLTETELARIGATAGEAVAKLTALGQDIPPGIQRIADATKTATTSTFDWRSALTSVAGVFGVVFSVNALKNFVLGVVETASHVGDLADKLAVSTEAVQRWSYAAKLGGTSIDAVDKAVATMNRTLSAGGTGTSEILDKIGLSFQSIRSQSPESAFDAITAAIERTSDPMLRAEAATRLFGKAGQELLPAIQKGFADTAKSAAVMSDDTIARLKEAEDAWSKLYQRVTVASGEMLARILSDGEQFRAEMNAMHMAAAGVADTVDHVAEALTRLKPPILATNAAANGLTLSEGEIADAIGHLDKAITESIAKHERYQAAMEEINSAGEGWQGTLAKINGETVAAVRYYLEAGVSQNALATAYGLTATQIKAVSTFMTEQIAVEKKMDQGILETLRVWDEYDTIRARQSGTSTDVQIAQIKRWADDLTARVHRVGADTAEFYDALGALSKAKMDDILIDWGAVSSSSSEIYQRNLQQIADKAQATFQYMLDNAGVFSSGTINHFQDIAIAAQQAADNWSASFESAGAAVTGAVAKTAAAVKSSTALAGVTVTKGDTTNEERMRSPAFLGPSSAPVNWNGPAFGGNSLAVQITVNALGTPSNVAQDISNQILQNLKRNTLLPA